MSAPQLPTRHETVERFVADGGGIAAVFPIHAPRALFRAFGLLPVEVWGPPHVDTLEGAAHVQSYACSIVRCGLSFALGGGLEKASHIVVPHACDSLQGLGSVLIDFVRPDQTVLPLYLPRGDRESDREFLAAELRAMFERLAETTGRRPSDAELTSAIRREVQADLALSELLSARSNLALSNRIFYGIARSREYLPAEEFILVVAQTLVGCGGVAPGSTRLLLSGIVPEPLEILDALDEADVCVVADDMACVGRRRYAPGEASDPFERMAERLLSGPPDPTRSCSIGERVEHLAQLCVHTGARGALFYTVKFCEPELFQHPLVMRGLERAGVATLVVEADIGDALSGQSVTRLEAFAETLS